MPLRIVNRHPLTACDIVFRYYNHNDYFEVDALRRIAIVAEIWLLWLLCRTKFLTILVGTIAFGLIGGCGNLFASFGGSIAGDRGTIQVVIINNTPNQAMFTLGTFDPTNENSQPDIVQFSADPDQLQLPGQTSSDLLTLTCARVLSVGSSRLLEAISQNLVLDGLDEAALVEGISFGDLTDDGSTINEVGSSMGFEALLGSDFSCNSLIILQLEAIPLGENAFRIAFSFIPSSSDR